MYTRDYKIFAPGEFFHIYNRGNHKQNIFEDDSDYEFFTLRLRQNLYPDRFDGLKIQALPPNSFSLISYCLMPNHFHLLVRQNSEIPTSKLMLKICSSYSKVFNKRYNYVGHLFQDQFKQILINRDEHLKWVIAYICQNPTVADLVKDPSEYRWSGYNEHLGKKVTPKVCDDKVLNELFDKQDIGKFIRSSYEIIKNNKLSQKVEDNIFIDC